MRTQAAIKLKTSWQFIRKMSAKLGFNGRELSRAIGVSPATICMWSQGQEEISVARWKLIFNYLESRGDSKGNELLELAKHVAIEEYKSKLGIA